MLILGINGGGKTIGQEDARFAMHDAAAVLIENGRVVAAIEEERLSRLKHCNCFPENAIRFCMDAAHASFEDIAIVATNDTLGSIERMAKRERLTDPRSLAPPGGAAYLNTRFERSFGVNISSKLYHCHHHLAHAASAFVPSGFDESLVLTLDGDGDGISGMVLRGSKPGLEVLKEFPIGKSLGHLYCSLISILGYGVFDEYKVMGLAPYGDAREFESLFERHYRLLDGGDYELEPLPRWFSAMEAAGLFGEMRRKGGPFTQAHMDFSAALQATIERILLHVASGYRHSTGLKNLCLAGGVAHNCTANGRIIRSGLFQNVYVQPAAHDAGGALGAALYAWCRDQGDFTPEVRQTYNHVYWGSAIDLDGIPAQLDSWAPFIRYRRIRDVAAHAAELVSGGAVIGWVQGRSEFGPRALGNRSIIADPRPASNKDRINGLVKRREAYRPFAPSVLEERAAEFFEIDENTPRFPYMSVVLQVREAVRAALGAVTHVDGSARVQTVSRKDNELYWRLIYEFGKRTGVPVVVNTSLNNQWEPIVDSAEDALACFLTTGLDHLVIGDYVVSKTKERLASPELFGFVPELRPYYLLAQQFVPHRNDGGPAYSVKSVKSDRFCSPFRETSKAVFRLLQEMDGSSDVFNLAARAGLDLNPGEMERIARELVALWEERILTFRPAKDRRGAHALTDHVNLAAIGTK